MDIAGAKALKDRLGPNHTDEALPRCEGADVPPEAPPVYRWTGKTPPEPRTLDVEEQRAADTAALFRRLGLSFR